MAHEQLESASTASENELQYVTDVTSKITRKIKRMSTQGYSATVKHTYV